MKTPGSFSGYTEENKSVVSDLFDKSVSAMTEMYVRQSEINKDMMANFLKTPKKTPFGFIPFIPGMEILQKNIMDFSFLSGKMILSAFETYFSLVEKTTRDTQAILDRINKSTGFFKEDAVKALQNMPHDTRKGFGKKAETNRKRKKIVKSNK